MALTVIHLIAGLWGSAILAAILSGGHFVCSLVGFCHLPFEFLVPGKRIDLWRLEVSSLETLCLVTDPDYSKMEESDLQTSFSAEGSWSPPPVRACRSTAKPRSASVAAAAKIKARARSRSGRSKADERTALVRQRALDKEFAKASGVGPQTVSVPAISGQQVNPQAPSTSEVQASDVHPQGEPSQQDTVRSWSPDAVENPQPTPGPSRVVPRAPEATFTPTAAGLRQESVSESEVPVFMRRWIDQAIRSGIAEGMRWQSQAPVPLYSYRPELEPLRYLPEREDYLDPASPTPSELSRYAEEFQGEDDFSESEQEAHQRPAFKGLFNPTLLKPLLAKAKATAGMGQTDKGMGSGEQDDFLFSEQPVAADTIPVPDMFLDTIRRQWASPATATRATGLEGQMFEVDATLLSLLEVPKVDAPVAALTSSSVLPPDADDALKAEDRKEETALRRAHLAGSWAVRASTSASFFTRASVRWLRHLQSHLAPEDVRAHQDLSKILAAAEYTADATLAAAKFSARAMASSVTARRMLWLRHWRMDGKNKWKLASAPFGGGQLFGQALDPLLVETKDKRKVLPSQGRRSDFRPFPYYRRPSFRQGGAGAGFPRQQKPFQYSRPSFQADRPSFGRGRQQSSSRPFRGAGGKGARKSK